MGSAASRAILLSKLRHDMLVGRSGVYLIYMCLGDCPPPQKKIKSATTFGAQTMLGTGILLYMYMVFQPLYISTRACGACTLRPVLLQLLYT